MRSGQVWMLRTIGYILRCKSILKHICLDSVLIRTSIYVDEYSKMNHADNPGLMPETDLSSRYQLWMNGRVEDTMFGNAKRKAEQLWNRINNQFDNLAEDTGPNPLSQKGWGFGPQSPAVKISYIWAEFAPPPPKPSLFLPPKP